MAQDTMTIQPSWVACLFGSESTDYKFAQIKSDGIYLHNGKGLTKLSFDEIRQVETTSGFFWREIRITLVSGNAFVLGGISSEEVAGRRQKILNAQAAFKQEKQRREQEAIADQQALQNKAVALLGEKTNELRALNLWHKKANQGQFWVTQRDLHQATATMDACWDIYKVPLETVTPSATLRMALTQLKKFREAPTQFRQAANQRYSKNEAAQFKDYFDTIEAHPLTDAQRLAIIAHEHNVLVIAGAGSGKTSVIVAKAGYLLKKGLCRPDQLLLLAYNKSAADEMSERIQQRAGIAVRATTFHALGLSILGEVEGNKPSLTRYAADGQLKPLIRELLVELTRDATTATVVRTYFQSFFAPYKSQSEFKSLGEYYDYLRDNNLITLKGETVKSYEEIEIANFLCLNGVAYEYEPKYKIPVADATHRQYQPDFYLPDHDIYIEHFGIGRDGSTAPQVDQTRYAEGMAWKRQTHRQYATTLIETFSYEKREGKLLSELKRKLAKQGVELHPVGAEELANILATSEYLDPFSDLVTTFLNHFKGGGHTIKRIQERAKELGRWDSRLDAFLNVFKLLLDRYEKRLKQDQNIDFNDMIIRAAESAESQRYQSPYTYLLVDEFQDISSGRARLVKALVKQAPGHRLFCVGDDWQAIYRFAGSDIALMRHFEDYFGWTEQVALDRTFRFNDRIEAVATRFVLKNPAQITKTIKTETKARGQRVFIHRPEVKHGDIALRVLKDMVQGADQKPRDVLFLGRYNFLEQGPAWSTMKQTYPGIQIRFQTIHRAKGQEADCVIVLGMHAGKYGFPSEIADDPLLDLVLSEPEGYEHAEERRLFYVALTRARHAVHLIADYTRPSRFLGEIMADDGVLVIGKAAAETANCPVCKTGRLMLRSGTNGAFYGCSHYPLCTHTANPCQRCGTGLLVLQDTGKSYVCHNPNCQHTERVCPSCKTGRLVERNGRSGPFLGCSNFSKGICQYTENFHPFPR